MELLEARELMATGPVYTVTTAADGGANSLRAAITLADGDGNNGADSIQFAIPGTGPQTINLLTPLPAITRPLAIDGTTQPGSGGKPFIQLSGSAVAPGGDGLTLGGFQGGVTVRGLSIGGFTADSTGAGGDGIFIAASSPRDVIEGDYLGVAPDGATATPNAVGIEVDSAGNTIGATDNAINVNVISGNAGAGVFVNGNAASGNVIDGDYIGTDVTGNVRVGNTNGVVLAGPANTVGGMATSAIHNVISGNFGSTGAAANVLLEGISTGNTVEGNYIGTNLLGDAAIQSGFGFGIYLGTPPTPVASDNVAGDSIVANLISGNFTGIFGNATALTITQNDIGLNASGTAAIPNGEGIFLGTSGSTIGGVGQGNVISGNSIAGDASNGIRISGDKDVIQGNLVGLNTTENAAIGNGVGMALSLTNSTVGGTASGAGNTISGNAGDGIFLNLNSAAGDLTGGDLFEGNSIGSATAGLGNGSSGIGITVAAVTPPATAPLALADTIGGTVAGAGNTIVGNGGAGISVINNYGQALTGLTIRQNSIYGNARLGIDLNASGTPIPGTLFLTSNSTSAGQATLNGTFQGTPGVTYAVDFFGSTTPDPSGYGQGQFFLGSANLTPDGAGLATFSQTFANPNAATSFSATSTDPVGTTSEFSLNNPAVPAVAAADLAVIGNVSPATVAVGGALTFTETVTNNGPAAATGVVFNDTIPTGLINTSVTFNGTTTTLVGPLVTEYLGMIAPGASVTVTINGTASQAATITNLAGAAGTTLDSNYSNNEASQVVGVTQVSTPQADLAITETASPTVATVGNFLFFTLTVNNLGPIAATNVTVNDFLPTNATLANVVPSQGGFASLQGSLVTDNLGTIAPGGQATITVVVTPTAGGTITNAANVSGNQPDPATGNNSTTLSVSTSGGTTNAPLTLAQTPTPTIGMPGQIQLFTLTVHNPNAVAASGVVLVDALPANATFAFAAPSQGGPASLAGGIVTDNIGTLAAGATATLTLVLVPTTSAILVNFAALIATGATPVYSQAFLVVPSGPSVVGVAGHGGNGQLIVNYNEPLTPGSAANPANYKLYALGRSPRALTSRDRPVAINSITYIPQTNGVVFTPSKPLDPAQYYTLVIVGNTGTGITDIAGRKLIGSGSGQVGTNFTATFLAGTLPQL